MSARGRVGSRDHAHGATRVLVETDVEVQELGLAATLTGVGREPEARVLRVVELRSAGRRKR